MESNEKKWNAMKEEYRNHNMSEKQVLEMKEKIEKAKKENRKKETSRIWKSVIAAAAGIAIVLAVLPNTSPTVAYAMSRVPLLSKFVEVVTFRDYQYSDDRNNADITVPEVTLSTELAEDTEGSDASVSSEAKKSTDEINSEIQSITNELIQEFEDNQKSEAGYQDMTVTSEVLATTDRYFTLKLICFQSAGSGAETDYYYTIDLDTGKRLALSDLFQDGSDYITPISDNIKKQMKAQMAADENTIYWLDSDMPEWDFKSISEDTAFYLNENNELVICFNEGDVGPMSMGCVQFVIPNEVIASIRK